MKVAVLKAEADTRTAATTDTVKKLIALGAEVAVETGAGTAAGISDALYEGAGAIVGPAETVLAGADVVLVTDPPGRERLGKVAGGAKLIGMLNPFDHEHTLADYANANIDAFAMELLPRITRAQSMDVLSSQANLAGYKAVIDAAAAYGRAFPMMMTAAGTVAPAKVFVMGAGVAGLQAVATAKRLGAVVSATDVRFAAKEQVESLGGSFVTVDEEAMKAGETKGGYAKEMSADFQQRQAAHVTEHLKKMDIVITTALIPGRPAPKLLTEAMVGGMKPGSVIVDLAAPRGGNVEGGQPGGRYQMGPATVLAPSNILEGLPGEASNLYARNLLNFVTLLTDKEEKKLAVDWDDEIVKGVCLTRDGRIVHERFATLTVPATPEIEDAGEVDNAD
ncbi:Re/Si-specific NAD(P)(+) transhydrogenase subunit alpha [Parvularcula sp. LCG005]|uniref:Re/Si-specific NAD(P)(+) transhydrogenase subunit alpha n=1 Tax=Parvularcula sp. LCG005 TaxID=3078805 RepID=UPI002943EA74|nr:Re/Si-specific NAD(P)(+) transhydrogenase subunit alpha [Parvularcula sp. LCG005]WOI52317.1 Re/Si-specific NAD(P)(+) transhydrogenase subunit alpha [Parvularcula sp. LCG005]